MLYHLISPKAWQAAQDQGYYAPPSLKKEGFIHFSTAAQVAAVAKRFYHDTPALLLLHIDEKRLKAPLQYDDNTAPDGSIAAFPHLYGKLNLDAVQQVQALERAATGDYVIDLG